MEDDEQSTVTNADDDEEFNDPITCELMCDPVKGTDGRTYDRWTIIDNDLTRSPFDQSKSKPFRIECDDINVRGRLFKKYPEAEALFRELRHDYRKEAMKLARGGHDAEALVMLENVLKWADDDSECFELRDLILERKSQQDFATGVNIQERETSRSLPFTQSSPTLPSRSITLPRDHEFHIEEHIHRVRSFDTTSSRDIPPRSKPKQGMHNCYSRPKTLAKCFYLLLSMPGCSPTCVSSRSIVPSTTKHG